MICLELQPSLSSASSCLSHIDLGTENGAGHATIMTTATDDLAINNSLAAIGSTRNLYNSQKSKLYHFCLQIFAFLILYEHSKLYEIFLLVVNNKQKQKDVLSCHLRK